MCIRDRSDGTFKVWYGVLGTDDYLEAYHDGTDGTINVASGKLIFSVAGISQLELINTNLSPANPNVLILGGGSREIKGIYLGEGTGSGACFGLGQEYRIYYDNTNTRLALWSADTDGVGTGADLVRIPKGQETVDFNATADDNAFDKYDDAVVLASAFSPEVAAKLTVQEGAAVLSRGREALVEAGVYSKYEDGWIGCNQLKMNALLAGGVYQTRALVDATREELIERIQALEERVKELEAA